MGQIDFFLQLARDNHSFVLLNRADNRRDLHYFMRCANDMSFRVLKLNLILHDRK